MTREELLIQVQKLQHIYGASEVVTSNAAFDTWYEALEDLEGYRFAEAVKMYIRNVKYAPKPADLRVYYNKVAKQGESFEEMMIRRGWS